MSVYTPLPPTEMARVLAAFGYSLVNFRGASHGIENSTFLIDATDSQGRSAGLVLTVFENLDRNELEGSIDALSLALAEYGSELVSFARG